MLIRDHDPDFQNCPCGHKTWVLVFERCLGGSGHVCSSWIGRVSPQQMTNFIE